MRRSFGRTYIPGFIDLKRWLKLWIYTWNENNNNELYLYIIHPCYCIWSNILQTTKSILSKSKHEREPIDVDFCRPSYKSDRDRNVANFAAELTYEFRKRRYWNTTDCVISSLQRVWKPLIEENFRKLSYLSRVVFCHSTWLLQSVIKIDLITKQLKSKFICDRSTHWIHFKIPLIFCFGKDE